MANSYFMQVLHFGVSQTVEQKRPLVVGCPGCVHYRQQKFRVMTGAHLASPTRGDLGYAHWPQRRNLIQSPIGAIYKPMLVPDWVPKLGPIRVRGCLP